MADGAIFRWLWGATTVAALHAGPPSVWASEPFQTAHGHSGGLAALDEPLERNIEAELARACDLEAVRVDVSVGTAVLTGIVADPLQRNRAEGAARAAGAWRVDNRVQVDVVASLARSVHAERVHAERDHAERSTAGATADRGDAPCLR